MNQKQYAPGERTEIEIAFYNAAKPVIPQLEEQVWIGDYKVDFLIPDKKIIIEVDGYQYHNSKDRFIKDRKRERNLQKMGYNIVRFAGTEIFKDVNNCVKEVLTLGDIEPYNLSMEIKKAEEIEKQFKTPAYLLPKHKRKANNARTIVIIIMAMTALSLVGVTIKAILDLILQLFLN